MNPLSPRELQVLQLKADGLAFKDIAERLGISLGAVNTYAKRAKGKLGVYHTTHAVAIAIREGWIT